MLDFLEEVYTANKGSNNHMNYRILRNFSRWILLVTKVVFIFFGGAFAFLIMSPLPIYLLTGKLEPIFPVHIPFVDTETTLGYAIHFFYVLLVMSSAYFGLAASEMLTIILTVHIAPLVSIFSEAIKALNEATSGPRQDAIRNSTWLRKSFRNIVLMHITIYL